MKKVLIVEDEYFSAIMMAEVLKENDYDVLAIINNVKEGVEFVKTTHVDFALLDYNIRGGTSEPVGEVLEQKSIPYISVSGNQNQIKLQEGRPWLQILPKPFSELDLLKAVEGLLGYINEDPQLSK